MNVFTSGSVFIRAYLTDCNGDAVPASAISDVKLNIFETFTPQTTVVGYTNKTIPMSSMLGTVQTDENGNRYNFECNPWDGTNPMFPKRQTSYTIEVVWFDPEGKPSAHQICVDAF